MPEALPGELRVAGVVPESITDGPGLRYAIFVQGCAHRCPGCHNPHTHDPAGGDWWPLERLWAGITANPLLGGVTLTGGEPFEQAAALLPLARRIVARGLELAAYSGYTFEELAAGDGQVRALLGLCHVLVDGPFVAGLRNLDLPFRGSENQRIIHVAASLRSGAVCLMDDGRWQALGR